MEKTLRDAAALEKSPLCKDVIGDLCLNLDAARQLHVPVCQDTGMAVVFLEVGQEIHIVGGGLEDAVNEGVRQGYVEGRLRLSVVSDPLRRENTGDNTPAVIHTSVVPGDKLHVTVAPKGFGSENMSAIRMFTPSATENDIVEFVAETVSRAGSLPCPPVVVGVGIGGDFEYAALLSKKALCRPLCQPQNDPFYKKLEENMLDRINRLGIGSQGFGGTVTALAVNIEVYATHIAGLPVAVNMGCHVTRHKSATL
jgi:fumarate hydratase subunit alpha